METILDFYTGFVESIPSESTTVDMSKLFDESEHWSPVQLKYDNKEESIGSMSAGIIKNLCQTYKSDTIFDKDVLDNISKIVLGSADIHKTAQRMMLVQYSKIHFESDELAFMLANTDTLRVKDTLCPDEIEWRKLGYKVIAHEQINKTIEEAITHFGQIAPDGRLTGENVIITFVQDSIPTLRGFVGIDEVFVHVEKFHNKINAFQGNVDQLQYIAKMDIISVILHALAHLKIRKATNDFNMHTPRIATLTSLPPLSKELYEFGVFVERKFFGKQVNWFHSTRTLKRTGVKYIERFINAIESQTPLPDGCIKEQLLQRVVDPNGCAGVDIEVEIEIC